MSGFFVGHASNYTKIAPAVPNEIHTNWGSGVRVPGRSPASDDVPDAQQGADHRSGNCSTRTKRNKWQYVEATGNRIRADKKPPIRAHHVHTNVGQQATDYRSKERKNSA